MIDGNDMLLLARIQFAFTVAWHIIFPAFTIGLASYLAMLEGLYLKTGRDVYMKLYRFWVKICSVDKCSALKQARVESGLPYTDMIPFGQAVIAAAPDRVIWGSDWPHGNTFEPGRIPNEGDLLDLIASMAGEAATLNKILVDNPARLYFD